MNNKSFLTESIMQGQDWKGLELAVMRLLSHCGWENIQYVGESGDKGADILAVRYNKEFGLKETFLFQVKAVHSAYYVQTKAINQAITAQSYYGAKIVVVVTNGDFTNAAKERRSELKKQGYDVRLWNGVFLEKLLDQFPQKSSCFRVPRIEYQSGIIDSVVESYKKGKRKSMFVIATGLGKTVIAATIANKLFELGLKKILVLCHAVDLAIQLQREFWSQISKEIPTRNFMAGAPPVPIEGINFGLYQTLFSYLGGIDQNAFDLIIVDEAHHALANGFLSCINHLTPKFLIGMTATPWRGDGKTVESIFGEPIASISLIDGMRMGFLAKVDYRLMCDNIDWGEVHSLTKKTLSIKDLNKKLFIPQRDDAVISEIIETMKMVKNPRIAVFSPSITHAKSFVLKLVSAGIPAANLSVDDKIIRRKALLDFSAGKINCITAVDVLNEGIDIPCVNILVFLRATHSRRIFIQQLGRGLRISKGKSEVIVLDFVTDIRRLAAVSELNKEAKFGRAMGNETVYLRNGVVTFNNTNVQKFIDAWINDIASLQDCDDAEKLRFPDMEVINE